MEKEDLQTIMQPNGSLEKLNTAIKASVKEEEAKGDRVTCHLSLTVRRIGTSNDTVQQVICACGDEQGLTDAFCRLFVKNPEMVIILGRALDLSDGIINSNIKAI
jgi:hypothetical protein